MVPEVRKVGDRCSVLGQRSACWSRVGTSEPFGTAVPPPLPSWPRDAHGRPGSGPALAGSAPARLPVCISLDTPRLILLQLHSGCCHFILNVTQQTHLLLHWCFGEKQLTCLLSGSSPVGEGLVWVLPSSLLTERGTPAWNRPLEEEKSQPLFSRSPGVF